MKNLTSVLAVGLVLVCLFLTSAQGAVRPFAFTFGGGAGGYFFDSEQDLEDSPVFNLSLGYNIDEHWAVEGTIGYVHAERESTGNPEVDQYSGQLDFLYHFLPDGSFVPYLALGAGGLALDREGTDDVDQDGFANWGLGLKCFFNDTVALRADARHLVTIENSDFEGSEFNNFAVTGGVQFQFGGAPLAVPAIDSDGDGIADGTDRCPNTPPGREVDPFGCPQDSDRDGIPDAEDRCPQTSLGATVDSSGCPVDQDGDGVNDEFDRCPDTPAGTRVDGQGCPPPEPLAGDADKDGIGDSDDKCPNTPASVPVNPYGCPRDSDHDGVFDVDDNCPGTGGGVAVGPDGCPPPKPAALELQIEFASGKAILSPEALVQLEQAQAFIAAHPGARIVVEGHTDSIGTARGNLKLSQLRAESVSRHLAQVQGLAPGRIAARGLGETNPVADNGTPAGRKANRRVVITLAE